MKEPLVRAARLPLFIRSEHRDMEQLSMNSEEFSNALNDGFIRVYTSSELMPDSIAGIVKKIQIDENRIDSYIEFDIIDTEPGRMIKTFYDIKIPQFASAVFLWNTCDITDAHLKGFRIHAQSSVYKNADEELRKFLRHIVPPMEVEK